MQRITPIVEHQKPLARLSCESCQRRKRKCDKAAPCSACLQSGLVCMPIRRARLPRGRHVPPRDGDLKHRVARLESLLSQMHEGASVGMTPPEDDTDKTSTPAWSAINEEVIGLRELLDNLVKDEPHPLHYEDTLSNPQSFDILLYGDSSCFVHPNIFGLPSWKITSTLLDIYLYRVDPIFKVCHTRSLQALILETELVSLAQQALKFSVYFAAVNSLTGQECSQLLRTSKPELSDKFKLASEASLSKCELLTTTNLTVLQAFVIYLAGLRVLNGSRAVSVLVGTAVRIGQFLGLDLEKTKHPPFETEMRRRIWYSIGILDLQAAFDSGSYSALASSVMLKTPPLHINDEDISPITQLTPEPRTGFCDMTFPSATHEMLHQMRKMIHTPLDSDGSPIPAMQMDWAQRYAVVEDCARSLNEKFVKYCNLKDPFQLFTKIVCEAMVTTLRLHVRRPMYRFYSAKPPPADGFNVLEVSTKVLEQVLRKTEQNEFKAWQWFAWVKWYALAIVLAELCEHTEGSLVNKAWVIAEASFAKYKSTIQDPALWGSLEKLMRKAQSARSFKTKKTDGIDSNQFGNISPPLGTPRLKAKDLPAPPEWTIDDNNSFQDFGD